jgi:hypothetical protein
VVGCPSVHQQSTSRSLAVATPMQRDCKTGCLKSLIRRDRFTGSPARAYQRLGEIPWFHRRPHLMVAQQLDWAGAIAILIYR